MIMLELQANTTLYRDTDIVVSNYGKDLSKVAKFLLSKEQYILDNYPFVSDFGTLLPTSVTTRSSTYNAFQFIDECSELEGIRDYIIEQYWQYVKTVGFDYHVVRPGINCWFNVLRKGENFGFHRHSNNERSFVCATMSIQVDNTKTIYKKNGEIVKEVNNREGEFAMFKADLEHGTTVHYGDKPRVTLGIDIFFDIETTKASPEMYNSILEF